MVETIIVTLMIYFSNALQDYIINFYNVINVLLI